MVEVGYGVPRDERTLQPRLQAITTRTIPSRRLSTMSGSVSLRTWATRTRGWPSHRFSARPRAPWRREHRDRSAGAFARRWVPHWARRPRVRGAYRRRSGGWNVWGSSTLQTESGRLPTRGLGGGSWPGRWARSRGSASGPLEDSTGKMGSHGHRGRAGRCGADREARCPRRSDRGRQGRRRGRQGGAEHPLHRPCHPQGRQGFRRDPPGDGGRTLGRLAQALHGCADLASPHRRPPDRREGAVRNPADDDAYAVQRSHPHGRSQAARTPAEP